MLMWRDSSYQHGRPTEHFRQQLELQLHETFVQWMRTITSLLGGRCEPIGSLALYNLPRVPLMVTRSKSKIEFVLYNQFGIPRSFACGTDFLSKTFLTRRITSMASSTLGHGFTTRSESALDLTCMKLLEISDNASHEDLLSLLSLVQMLEVDILPLMWYPALHVGKGGFAVLNEAPVSREVNFAFKRSISLGSTSEKASGSFSSSMKEIAILRHYNVSKHPNIVDFYGICWKVDPVGGQILPALVLEKAQHGDLLRFRNSSEGKKLSVKTKLSLCTQIAEGLAMLHASCESSRVLY
jgi:serine/threonine protein kinase